jgi:chromosomal replication initiator protein
MGALTPAHTHDPAAAAALWTRVQEHLKRAVDGVTYDIWLAPLAARAVDGAHLTVAAPDERKRRWVDERFGPVLREAVRVVLGPAATISVVAADAPAAAATAAPARPAPVPRPLAPDDLNPKLTFDQFVIGERNRLAHAAALAVAELPGTAYNPLFIYGPPGVGKTPPAPVDRELRPRVRARPDRPLHDGRAVHERVHGGAADDGHGPLQGRVPRERRPAHRRRPVPRAQGAHRGGVLPHVQRALRRGAQLVLTSDRTPRDLDALAERLRRASRRPGHRHRRARSWRHPRRRPAQARGARRRRDVDDAVSPPSPSASSHNVRALEGPSSASSPTPRSRACRSRPELWPSASAGARSGRGPRPVRRGKADESPRSRPSSASASAVTRDELLSATRTGRIAWPRQVAMFLAREETGASLPAIGAAFGGRNHTTVLHAIKRVAQRTAEDVEAREAVHALTARLRADRPG